MEDNENIEIKYSGTKKFLCFANKNLNDKQFLTTRITDKIQSKPVVISKTQKREPQKDLINTSEEKDDEIVCLGVFPHSLNITENIQSTTIKKELKDNISSDFHPKQRIEPKKCSENTVVNCHLDVQNKVFEEGTIPKKGDSILVQDKILFGSSSCQQEEKNNTTLVLDVLRSENENAFELELKNNSQNTQGNNIILENIPTVFSESHPTHSKNNLQEQLSRVTVSVNNSQEVLKQKLPLNHKDLVMYSNESCSQKNKNNDTNSCSEFHNRGETFNYQTTSAEVEGITPKIGFVLEKYSSCSDNKQVSSLISHKSNKHCSSNSKETAHLIAPNIKHEVRYVNLPVKKTFVIDGDNRTVLLTKNMSLLKQQLNTDYNSIQLSVPPLVAITRNKNTQSLLLPKKTSISNNEKSKIEVIPPNIHIQNTPNTKSEIANNKINNVNENKTVHNLKTEKPLRSAVIGNKTVRFKLKEVNQSRNTESCSQKDFEGKSLGAIELLNSSSDKTFSDKDCQTYIYGCLYKNDKLYMLLDEDGLQVTPIPVENIGTEKPEDNLSISSLSLSGDSDFHSEDDTTTEPEDLMSHLRESGTIPQKVEDPVINSIESGAMSHNTEDTGNSRESEILNSTKIPGESNYKPKNVYDEILYTNLGLYSNQTVPLRNQETTVANSSEVQSFTSVEQNCQTISSNTSKPNNTHIFVQNNTVSQNPNGVVEINRSLNEFPVPYEKLLEKLLQDIKSCVTPDALGNRPLHQAVIKGDIKSLKSQCLILKSIHKKNVDINVNIMNLARETALMLAVKMAVDTGDFEAVSIMVDEDADQELMDLEGNTPLHYAIKHGNSRVVQILLNAKDANNVIEKFNHDGLSPLHLAAKGGHNEICRELINAGVDINSQERKSGRTPYFLAVEEDKFDTAQLLNMLGADTQKPNYAGQIPPSLKTNDPNPEPKSSFLQLNNTKLQSLNQPSYYKTKMSDQENVLKKQSLVESLSRKGTPLLQCKVTETHPYFNYDINSLHSNVNKVNDSEPPNKRKCSVNISKNSTAFLENGVSVNIFQQKVSQQLYKLGEHLEEATVETNSKKIKMSKQIDNSTVKQLPSHTNDNCYEIHGHTSHFLNEATSLENTHTVTDYHFKKQQLSINEADALTPLTVEIPKTCKNKRKTPLKERKDITYPKSKAPRLETKNVSQNKQHVGKCIDISNSNKHTTDIVEMVETGKATSHGFDNLSKTSLDILREGRKQGSYKFQSVNELNPEPCYLAQQNKNSRNSKINQVKDPPNSVESSTCFSKTSSLKVSSQMTMEKCDKTYKPAEVNICKTDTFSEITNLTSGENISVSYNSVYEDLITKNVLIDSPDKRNNPTTYKRRETRGKRFETEQCMRNTGKKSGKHSSSVEKHVINDKITRRSKRNSTDTVNSNIQKVTNSLTYDHFEQPISSVDTLSTQKSKRLPKKVQKLDL